MRSHLSCWNKTLTKLGFKRKQNFFAKQSEGRRRYSFELLEQRQMLSAVTVNTLVDDDDDWQFNTDGISLREALAEVAATSKTEVIFAPGLVGEILLQPGLDQLFIAGEVTIKGPGSDLLTIDAQGNSRVFYVNNWTFAF